MSLSMRRLPIASIALATVSFGSSSPLLAQNSSLFQRPIAFTQAPNGTQSTESLPAPNRGANGDAPNNGNPSNMVAIPGGQASVPQLYPANPGQGVMMMPPTGIGGQLGLQASYSYVPQTPARTLKLHDIVQIRIEETSTSLATGGATSRKTTSYDASLKEWIRLVGLDTLKPAPQSDGNPRVQSDQTEVYRGQSDVRTSESLTTNIAAEIVDIKPNGHIVLDATKDITVNDNSFRYSLTGICRAQDIGPDNVVLSRNLIRSKIDKQDLGHVRDGYSRGWLTKLMARVKPF